MPTQLFQPGNQLAKFGGLAKRGTGVVSKAKAWIEENGVEKAIEWVEGDDSRKATFAMGILFTYALGKPKETIEINTTHDALLSIKNDPRLDDLIAGFAKYSIARARGTSKDIVVGERPIEVQAIAPPGSSV